RKGSNARANRGLGIRRESDSKAGLKNEVLRLRKAIRQSVKKPIEFSAMKRGKTPAFRLRDSIARKHDSVVWITAHNESTGPIDNRSLRRIIKIGMEHREAVPAAMPRRPDRMAHTGLNGQLLCGFPTVLNEPIKCRRNPSRNRSTTE